MGDVLSKIPKDAEISNILYEGPRKLSIGSYHAYDMQHI